MHSHTTQVDGVPMRWEEAGEGRPVVLVHGIPTSPALWRHVAPRLDGVRALAWEMVGYGESIPAGRDRDISVGRQADHLVHWLRELGVERPVLVGHDLGGGVVQIAAARHRDLAAGLLLTNAIGYDSWPVAPVKAMARLGPVVSRLPAAAFGPAFKAFLRPGHDSAEQADEAARTHGELYRRHDAFAALVRQAAALDVQDTLAVQDALPELGLPARVVWGEADPFQKVRYGERFARDLDTELRRIPGAKHFTPEDHPEEIAAAIRDLVAEIDASS